MDLPRIRVVAAVITDGSRYLITQRRETSVFPLRWEFPGGRVEPGESDEAALTREIRERLAAHVQVGEHISSRDMAYANYQLSFHLYECRLLSDWHNVGVADSRWVRSEDFESYEFTPADEASLAALLSL